MVTGRAGKLENGEFKENKSRLKRKLTGYGYWSIQ